jgi:(E)-4-hydroxy-3-methylbut-2-enyl-diphosphate synthase
MSYYCESLTVYKRLPTREVRIGNLLMGANHPIRIQTMTTTDTMDTEATVAQAIRCIEAGAELVRITAPSKNEAENLRNIRDELHRRGYHTPLVADIHFTPNAAEIAAGIVEKVRINPGNYVDKKKFEQIEYTDEEYTEEIARIRERFVPLVTICKQHGTAMRIGTNHGSLSDRIMSRYGDTAIGMVESAMEFLRIARDEDYHNIVLSMKSSNPQVMVQAYRLLINHMMQEFGECYPLHLGVTEAGDGEDGRIKSAVGIGTLLEDGIGDTIRVSLTEDPELELPVCRQLVSRYQTLTPVDPNVPPIDALPYSPFQYQLRKSVAAGRTGGNHVPIVIADFSKYNSIKPQDLDAIGYHYDSITDKWTIADAAADFIFCNHEPDFALPGTLNVVMYHEQWTKATDQEKCLPLLDASQYLDETPIKYSIQHFVMVDCYSNGSDEPKLELIFEKLRIDPTAIVCLSSTNRNAMQSVRRMIAAMMLHQLDNPVVLICDSNDEDTDQSLIHYAVEAGALLIDGLINGICLGHHFGNLTIAPQTALLNSVAFGILQATRTRISKTEYISCPSCGRTLFDLQETTAKIRAVTHHLKGVKIAIMGCIVNGPGEMADADFGYVGSGPGKITLYKGKEVVKRNVNSEVAVDELIALIKENGAWTEKPQLV